MKFLSTFSVLIFILILNVQAQEYISKGHSILSGSFSANSTENKSGDDIYDNKGFSIAPEYGKFIKDNLALGVRGSISRNKVINRNNFREHINKPRSYSLGVFVKKYYPINDKFGAFINTNLEFSHYSSSNESRDIDPPLTTFSHSRSNSDIGLNSNLGLYYFLWKRFSIEATLGNVGIQKTISDQSQDDRDFSSESFQINFVNTLSFDQFFRLSYYF